MGRNFWRNSFWWKIHPQTQNKQITLWVEKEQPPGITFAFTDKPVYWLHMFGSEMSDLNLSRLKAPFSHELS
eukprot:TRINITY_DN3258_c4_g1_i1.p1 TRINITY_DN3258_c4_g1~~TRINITY_DN3258_c4_g1_i1.p1  ORF type:complete len:72 (-),score=10.52 TRINITY_DN3258_c4_g1_i1:178-393(-)